MIWHLLKYWIAFILPSFYRRIQGGKIKNLKIRGPAVVAMNHPNAFTDPVALSYICYPLRLKYMARGDAFKPGIISWLLEQIGIVPIFRLQDGGTEGLKKNDAAYRKVNSLLKRNFKIIVFAEGLCVQERRLRPLKKGVARMVFGAFEALNADNLVVIPVGINYSNPGKFRSDVFCNVGEPIAVKDFIDQFRENPARAHHAFLQELQPKMKELITHINDKNYDEVVYQVETLCKKDLIRTRGLNHKNLADDFIILKELTEKVNRAVEQNQSAVDEFKNQAGIYFADLKRHKVRDWLINPQQNQNVNYFNLTMRFFILCLGFPFYFTGIFFHFLPFKITTHLSRKMVKGKVEFYSSITVGLGMVFFLLSYISWFIIFRILTPNILWVLVFCALMVLSALFSLYYQPFLNKTAGMLRILKNKNIAANLSDKRKYLISLINKF